MKASRIQSVLGSVLRPAATQNQLGGVRWTHKQSQSFKVPTPIPLVPDVPTFLTVIGRGLRQHAPKFPTWEALFALTSAQMKELGIEPARSRRYLLQWRRRFQNGDFGVGGDLRYVENGTAELKVLEIEKDPLTRVRHVVNVPSGKKIEDLPEEERVPVRNFHVQGTHTVAGPYAIPLEGGRGAQITVTEGMWEDRRGHKVDGGERRKAEVRFKRRVAERKAQRDRRGF